MPEISVVIPVYNAEAFIRDTLDSILSQTFRDFELICIDDGSTDNTLSILGEYQSSDARVSVHSQGNLGPGAARNKGLDLAQGTYVIMLDADDLYHETMLQKMHDKAERLRADVIVARSTQFEDGTGTLVESWWTLNTNQIPLSEAFSPLDMRDFVFTAFLGWPWDKLFRRSFIEENGIRYPILPNSEDLYFVFLALAKARTIGIIDESLIMHRVNRQGSVSGSRAKAPLAFYESTCLLKEELKRDKDLYAELSWGFLNWALDYLVWNVETMDDPQGRAVQMDALAHDAFPELEVSMHSPAFYGLKPAAYDRYVALLHEANNLTNNNEQPRRRRRVLPKLIKFLRYVDEAGFRAAVSRGCRWLYRRFSPRKDTTVVEPKLHRGSDFALASSTLRAREKERADD